MGGLIHAHLKEEPLRQITDHIVEGDSVNHQLEVAVVDEPGQGGACHEYLASWAVVPYRQF